MHKKQLSLFCATCIIGFIGPASHLIYALEDTSDNNNHSISDVKAPYSVPSSYDDVDDIAQTNAYPNHESAQDDLRTAKQQQQQKFEETHYLANDGMGGQYYASTTDKDSCVTADHQPGQYFRTGCSLTTATTIPVTTIPPASEPTAPQ